MRLPSVSRLKDLKGKRVLVRVDFNVPVGKHGQIGPGEDDRIRASIPTIERLAAHGARVILISHFGEPDGREAKFSLAPAADRLGQLMRCKIRFIADPLEHDDRVDRKIAALEPGEIALLENLRFYQGEEKNATFFSRRLASLADFFVNDAFGTAHRAHASTVGVTRYLPSFAGYLMETEVRNLEKTLAKPQKPFVVLMGGAKISTKLHTLVKFLSSADVILLGGAMANNFFEAQGLETGASLTSVPEVRLAKKLLRKKKIMLPVDVLVAGKNRGSVRIAFPDDVGPDEAIMDIGPETIRRFAAELKKAKTIVWNGPMGAFETKKFSHGSIALGRLVAARSRGSAYGVVGGGETLKCLALTGLAEYVDHVSTGGGAMLEFLAGKTLPALAALESQKAKAKTPA